MVSDAEVKVIVTDPPERGQTPHQRGGELCEGAETGDPFHLVEGEIAAFALEVAVVEPIVTLVVYLETEGPAEYGGSGVGRRAGKISPQERALVDDAGARRPPVEVDDLRRCRVLDLAL